MKSISIDTQVFIENRKHFASRLEPKAISVFNANDVMPTSADGVMPFRQNSDLFYLTGVDQEESILIIFPNAADPKHREMLFLRETNEHIAIWEGKKLSKEEATKVSGIESVYWLDEFESLFPRLIFEAELVYLNTNEHTRATREVETRDDRFIKDCKARFPLHQYRRSAPILQELRSVKSKAEVALIEEACAITEKGFRRVLHFIKPGVKEYEIEAEFIHEFVRNGSTGFAYPPIIASGENSIVLHYVKNSETCGADELILMDVGASYANYNADMTRTVPISGKFTKRQKTVYNAVLKVMRKCITLLRPGVILKEYQKESGALVEEQLIQLGLLDKKDVKNQDPGKPLYKKYFMHGTSHFLGLDVHDVGFANRPIKEGMVLP